MNRLAAALLVLGSLPPAIVAQEAPPPEPEAHRVVRGNTLWDLALTFYGDPLEWPRIWEANRDRLADPNLILPGQLLRIPGPEGSIREVRVESRGVAPAGTAGEPPAAAARQDARAARPAARARPGGRLQARGAPERAGARQTAAQRGDVYAVVPDDFVRAAPFLIPDGAEVPFVGRIRGFAGADEIRAPRPSLRPFDRLVLSVEDGAPAVGGRLQAFRLTREAPGVGRVATPTAVLRVVERGASGVIAQVERMYDRALVGDLVRALPGPGSTPGVLPQSTDTGEEAMLVTVAVEHAVQSVGDAVFLDAGGGVLSLGDELVPVWPTADPDRPEGRLRVIAVQTGFATARIVGLRNPVFERGLRLRVVARMPVQ